MDRVLDTNQNVVSVLYEQPLIVLPLFVDNADAYIGHITAVLAAPGSKPKKSLLRIHLAFLASHFLAKANISLADDVFHRIFFPLLLFSKSRQHTTEIVWEIISADLRATTGAYELLKGCPDIVKAETNETHSDPIAKMSSLNRKISIRIAG